ncbi:HtrA protease/chaperone protein [Acidisarcina polymorpha]|uniref:HtrA protease/chaperone protein n=1 Tax=Acidisarcina polymorpha TaxID=2211140 RepID=A0A2Z5G636_9BACT|nr:trypsin-like peptidase domain-containing protein [Acidisarcina polymorpha]AXC14429.1 HtrA protease/chaperone protein [Acidisarcina polymorpha]
MKSLLERLRVSRLATTFTILATLSAGILIGSVVAHGVKGQEAKVDSSDASPLRVPNPKVLSNTFSQIAKQVGPAVVNINTETLPKASSSLRRKNPHSRQQAPSSPDDEQAPGDDDDQDDQGGQGGQGGQGQNVPPGFQDFFNRFFGGPDQGGPEDGGGVRESLGSGFIVDPKGYIITNNHVVDKADKIFVKLSTDPEGEQGRPARVVGVDKDTDIAVIKIEPKEPLPTVKLGNSDSEQVGDWVIAIGSPFDLSQTVTAGIVSAKNRTIEKGVKGQFQHFIQTDAAINPGNSGGPLLNMDGEVIGVNTAIYTQSAGYQGIGFAMPSNTVVSTYNQLIGPDHKVTRGSIGIQFQPDLPSAVGRVYGFKTGVLVSFVQPGGPGDKGGLKAGDIIVSIDGRPIKDGDDLVNEIAGRRPGSTAKLGYLRNGGNQTATITIGDRSKVFANNQVAESDDSQGQDQQNGSETKLGLTVGDVPAAAAAKTGIHGVLVQAVKPGSFADEIGVAQGGVIISVNKQKVANLQEFRSAISALKSGQDVVLELIDPRSPKSGSVFRAGTLP